MRRLGVLVAIATVLCASASQASARTFTIISPGKPQPAHEHELPSSSVPNRPGAVARPAGIPPANPAVLSFEQLRDLWQRAGSAYGVPWQVLGAINKIE
jgi:hypothetical protein